MKRVTDLWERYVNYELSPTYWYAQNLANFGPQTAKTNCMHGA